MQRTYYLLLIKLQYLERERESLSLLHISIAQGSSVLHPSHGMRSLHDLVHHCGVLLMVSYSLVLPRRAPSVHFAPHKRSPIENWVLSPTVCSVLFAPHRALCSLHHMLLAYGQCPLTHNAHAFHPFRFCLTACTVFSSPTTGLIPLVLKFGFLFCILDGPFE
jgi:hypothetical protein